MSVLCDMLWVEFRKAVRSRMPLWTALGSLFLPCGIGFLVFVARNPGISQKLGLISAKANLMSYSATDWPTYLGLFAQIVAAAGFLLFILAVSWVFGREFADRTLKDMLAVPVQRFTILAAKFLVVSAWSAMLTLVILIAGLLMALLLRLPGASAVVLWSGVSLVLTSAALAIAVVFPFALLASIGRGYLLPIGVAVLTLIMTNLVLVTGWGEYFPWAVPGIYAQGKTPLGPTSFWLVGLTGLAGVSATYLWWKYADQDR
jgi:ABC-2 type transport system permease protein